jgi:hypothetical protein
MTRTPSTAAYLPDPANDETLTMSGYDWWRYRALIEAEARAPRGAGDVSDREPLDICNALAQWAGVANVSSEAGNGYLAVMKSDLLHRLIYGGERGPSKTPCPVHKGKWSGCDFGWPGSEWVNAKGERTPVDVSPRLQEAVDAGCRCATHKGSGCTTGWNPDEFCCAALEEPTP